MPGVDINIAAIVNNNVFGGGDHGAGHGDVEEQLFGVGGDEVCQLLDVIGVGYIINPQSCVEIAAVNTLGIILKPVLAHGLMDIVRAEGAGGADAAIIEVGIREVGGNFGIGELCNKRGVCRIADIDHVQIVHGLCAGGLHLFLGEEGEALALVGENGEVPSGEGKIGVAARAAELARKGRLHHQLGDEPGTGGLGDVKNDSAAAKVAEIQLVGSVGRNGAGVAHRPVLFGCVPYGIGALNHAVLELLGHEPAAALKGIAGVGNIQNADDEAHIAGALSGHIDILAAVIGKAMDAHAVGNTGSPGAQELGMDGVFLQVIDLETVESRVAGVDAVEEGNTSAQSYDQKTVSHLNFGGGLRKINLGIADLNIVKDGGVGGIGHIKNIYACALEGSAVHIILFIDLIKRHLEGVDAVKVGETDHFHVLYIAFVVLAFCVEGNGHSDILSA